MSGMATDLSWRRVSGMMALTAALVLLANLAAWAYLQKYPANRAVSRVGQKWQMIERLGSPSDWVVVGDSSCGQGVRPDILSAELGGSAINLCTVANATVVNQAWMIQRYIEKYGPPKAVVMMNVFHMWERKPDDLMSMLDQIPLAGDFWNRMDPPLDVDARKRALLLLRPVTVLYSQHLSIGHVLSTLPSILMNGPAEVSSSERDLDSMIRAGGYTQENKPRPEKVLKDIDSHIEAYKDRSFAIARENLSALRAISALSMKHSFKLYVSNSSIANGLYAHPGVRRFFDEMHGRLKEELAENPNAYVVLRTPPGYEPGQMDNVDHVVGLEGAADLTRHLATAIGNANRATVKGYGS